MAKPLLTWAKDKKRIGRNEDLRESLSKPEIGIIGRPKKENESVGKIFYKKNPSFQARL